MNELASYLLSI